MGTDYAYEGGILTILSGKTLHIRNRMGAPAGDCIYIDSGVHASLVLEGVDIRAAASPAIQVGSGASLTISLAQDNTLQGGSGCVAISAAPGSLTFSAGTGALTAIGGGVQAIGSAPGFNDFVHATYASSESSGAGSAFVELSGAPAGGWSAWKWVRILPLDVRSVMVEPASASISLDGTNPASGRFSAALNGFAGGSQVQISLTDLAQWTVTGGTASGMEKGVLTVGAGETAQTLTVTARYTVGAVTYDGSATVTLTRPEPLAASDTPAPTASPSPTPVPTAVPTSVPTAVPTSMPEGASPLTGDESSPVLWLALLAGSAAALGAVLVLAKRKHG